MARNLQQWGKQQAQMRAAIVALSISAAVMLVGGTVLLVQMRGGAIATRDSFATARLVAGTYSSTIECPGTIEPISVFDAYVPYESMVVSLQVDEGDYVEQGDTLFYVVDSREYAQQGEVGETASRRSGWRRVEAEISGTVTNMRAYVGASRDDLSGQPAMQVADMNVLVGDVRIPEAAMEYIRVGGESETTVPSMPGYELTGTLIEFEDETHVDSEDRAYCDAVMVFGDTEGLQVGMSIETQIDMEDYGNVYYVAPGAVYEQDGCSYVELVYANNTVERHQVTTLGENGEGQKIISGDALADGSTIRVDLNE